jgi:predicted nucleic acid-binding protein
VALEGVTGEDLARAAALMTAYPEIGFVDASVVALAERLRLRQIATTDRRHFAAIRPRHAPAFELLP